MSRFYLPSCEEVLRHRPEYELDTDDLDGETLVQLETAQQHRPQHTGRHREQSVPLLVGLLDSASARRSADGSLQLEHRNPNGDTPDENVDLDALAAKQLAGGGMLDSIANMANSILGAGNTLTIVLRTC